MSAPARPPRPTPQIAVEEPPDDDAPPPYTPEAEPGMSLDANFNRMFETTPSVSPNPSPRPSISHSISSSSSGHSYTYTSTQAPPFPPRPTNAPSHTATSPGRPQPGRPQPGRLQPGRPPPGRPPAPSSAYPGAYRPTQPPLPTISTHISFQNGMPPRPGPPFAYPPGYHCPKCNNTGIKLKNGLQCQDCYRQFARQSAQVQFLPSASPSISSHFAPFMPSFTTTFSSPVGYPPPRVVQPGDPSIGGVLCGHCRGRGLIYEFLMEDTCPTCHGIGRLL